MSAPWTDEDKDLLRELRAQGVTMAEIARRLGRSEKSVKGQSERLGLALAKQAMKQLGQFAASDGFVSGYRLVWGECCACAICGEQIAVGDVLVTHRSVGYMHQPIYRHMGCKRRRGNGA